jgi:2-haloalkanoic acid dehalogenase type II
MPRSAKNRAPRVQAVALDAYGTIIDFTEPDFIVTMAEICDRQRLDADAADLWRRFLRAAFLLRAENHHQPVYRRYDEAWAAQFERVFRRLGLDGDPWDAARYLKKKLAAADAFEEARPAIETLGRHYPLGLVSNADDDFLSACLERNGLCFDTVVTSEQAKAIKPNPAIFLEFARRLNVAPDQILYAGDSPIPDLLGPRQAGFKVAWVNRSGARRPRKVPPPDLRVRSLTELVSILVPASV